MTAKYSTVTNPDKIAASNWAKEVLRKNDSVILDTETTGLYNAEIVEIAVIDCSGAAQLNTLVKPTISIPNATANIHGINNKTVIDAPGFVKIYPQIVDAIESKQVLIYNSAFDTEILNYCCRLHDLPLLNLAKKTDCLMKWYAQWVGDWNDKKGNYRWHPLNGGHRALDDCLAALKKLKEMAADDRPF